MNAREELLRGERRINVAYDKAFSLVKGLEFRVKHFDPDILVAVLRSGAIPAMMLSQRIDKPVQFCACNRADEQATMLQPFDFTGKRVLVVDDFASTGRSLQKVIACVTQAECEVKTLALFYDSKLATPPDFGHKATHFVQFAWDRLEVTPSSRLLFSTADSRYAPEAVGDFYGYDIKAMQLFPPQSPLFRNPFVILSAEPFEDYGTSLGHARQLGLENPAIICRATDKYGQSMDELARFKVDSIRALGVSVYYEADLEQAMLIAMECPVVDVIWWSMDRQLRISAEQVQ